MRRAQEVVTAQHLRHAHGRVVDDHGEHVPGAVGVAGEREIADGFRDGLALRAVHEIVEDGLAETVRAESPEGHAALRQCLDGGGPRGESAAAGAGIGKAVLAGVGCGLRGFNIGARAGAGVCETLR